jgi:O-acetyl-ADP-ribose deacetylase
VTTLRAWRGDITNLAVDAVVNAANRDLAPGSGVCGAIHRAGGTRVTRACMDWARDHGRVPTGGAVATTGGDLPAKWVIHAVGPVWSGGDPTGDDELLASAYRTSLEVAVEVGARSIAFPAISTGIYGFPKDRAPTVAVAAVRGWVEADPANAGAIDEVVFCCFDREDLARYQGLLTAS